MEEPKDYTVQTVDGAASKVKLTISKRGLDPQDSAEEGEPRKRSQTQSSAPSFPEESFSTTTTRKNKGKGKAIEELPALEPLSRKERRKKGRKALEPEFHAVGLPTPALPSMVGAQSFVAVTERLRHYVAEVKTVRKTVPGVSSESLEMLDHLDSAIKHAAKIATSARLAGPSSSDEDLTGSSKSNPPCIALRGRFCLRLYRS
jgi:hypothetical protein